MSTSRVPAVNRFKATVTHLRLVPLAAEAVVELTRAAILTRKHETVYFNRYDLNPVLAGAEVSDDTAIDTRGVMQIGRAVARMAAFVPFRAVCLQQSLATYRMLRRRGVCSQIIFGVRPRSGCRSGEPVAHAWVEWRASVVNGWRPDLGEFARAGRYG